MELGEHKTYVGTILLKVNDHKLVLICSIGGSNWGEELFVWVQYFPALNSYLFYKEQEQLGMMTAQNRMKRTLFIQGKKVTSNKLNNCGK